MSHQGHPHIPENNHGYEHRDIRVSAVLYFILALIVAGIGTHFVVQGIYGYLERRFEAEQPPVSPLVTNAPKDTRKLPVEYRDYLKENFPSPQLEVDERSQLDGIRLDEEKTLSTYGWVDQKAGTVRIPIERAMDLLVQRGLPVRQGTSAQGASSSGAFGRAQESPTKGTRSEQ